MRQVELRPATARDVEFLYRLHTAALREYVEQTWGWDESFQRALFAKRFDPASRKLICWAGSPVGSIGSRVEPDALHLYYIALLPAYQRRGIGTFLVSQLISDATSRGLPVRLSILGLCTSDSDSWFRAKIRTGTSWSVRTRRPNKRLS
jgi:ribosomal protein S18 acetylase RimI-like enzyme